MSGSRESEDGTLRHAMAVNAAVLEELVSRVDHAGNRRPAYAASLAQAAAEFAWFNHTGWYASPGLEAAVARLGIRHVPVARWSDPGPRSAHTLHVCTQMYPAGGSTQAIASWTDELSDRAHHLVVTRQRANRVPTKIASRLGDRVTLTRLDTRPGTLLQRAARLRSLARSAELVLVHAHPYDVVAALAFADRSGLPPVVYVDHADHVFWLGVTSVDHVMHMRASGQSLAIARRGLPQHRSLVRNRPLAFRGRTMDRGAAKAAWGIAAEHTLVVSAADATKFRRTDGPSLAELVEPVLRSRPDLRWRIAGPDPDTEPWASLSRRTTGRVRALGRLSDMSVLHQAADIFLDSFPFASLTSLLEAGAMEVPLVTFRGHPRPCDVFGSDSPGIDDLMFRPSDPAELEQTLTRLVDDPSLRTASGRRTAAAVVSSHGGPAWVSAMEELYDLPANVDSSGIPAEHGTGQVDLMTAAVQAATAHRRGVDETVAAHLGTMPPLARFGEWRARHRTGGPRALAPEWAVAVARTWRWSQVKMLEGRSRGELQISRASAATPVSNQ